MYVLCAYTHSIFQFLNNSFPIIFFLNGTLSYTFLHIKKLISTTKQNHFENIFSRSGFFSSSFTNNKKDSLGRNSVKSVFVAFIQKTSNFLNN